jgi:glycine cleavage system H protein
MANFPKELKYTKEHEWVKIENGVAVVGITEHAQSELGDIVFVEMPELGRQIKQNDDFGVVESVKTVSNLYSPVSGTVSAINETLSDVPETINKDAYNAGWIIKLEGIDPKELDGLLTAEQYAALVGA